MASELSLGDLDLEWKGEKSLGPQMSHAASKEQKHQKSRNRRNKGPLKRAASSDSKLEEIATSDSKKTKNSDELYAVVHDPVADAWEKSLKMFGDRRW